MISCLGSAVIKTNVKVARNRISRFVLLGRCIVVTIKTHFDCTENLFGTEVIEVTASDLDAPIGTDGGGNPYFQVSENTQRSK